MVFIMLNKSIDKKDNILDLIFVYEVDEAKYLKYIVLFQGNGT